MHVLSRPRVWRFSLASLLCCTLSLGALAALIAALPPWKTARTLSGHGAPTVLAFSPCGEQIVTANNDRLQLWDVRTGIARQSLESPNKVFLSAEFSADGKQILAATDVGIELWDALTNTRLHERLADGATAAFSTDATRILLVTAGGSVTLLDSALAQVAVLIEKNQPAECAEFSPDGNVILAVQGKAMRLFDGRTGIFRREIETSGAQITCAKFSPDSQHVLIVSPNALYVIRATDGRILTSRQTQGASSIYANYTPDGTKIMSVFEEYLPPSCADAYPSSRRRTFELRGWSADLHQQLFSMRSSDNAKSDSEALMRYDCSHHDGNMLLADGSGEIKVCSLNDGRCLAILPLSSTTAIREIRYAGNGIVAAGVTEDNVVTVWRRHRPEVWWGVFVLPELWLLVLIIGAAKYSLARDVGSLRKISGSNEGRDDALQAVGTAHGVQRCG